MNKYFKNYYLLVGIIIFIFLISKLDFSYYKEILPQFNFYYFLLAYLLLIPYYLIKSYRWKKIMEVQKISYSLLDTFLMYNAGSYLGIITPGKVGEFLKIFYLKKDGHSLGKSFVSNLLDRLLEIFLLFVLGYLSMFIFLNIFKQQIFLISAFTIVTVTVTFLFLKNKKINDLLKKIFYFFLPEKYQKSWQINYQDFKNDLRSYKIKDYIYFLVIGLLIWLIYFLTIIFLAEGINLKRVPIVYLLPIVTISHFLSFIPISISGIGTRDLFLIVVFSHFGVNKELAVAFSSLILLTYFFPAIMGLICWLAKPIRLKKS